MKILCKSATQVPGRGIVEKGQIVDWPDYLPFPPQVLGNFVEADSGAKLRNLEPKPANEADENRQPTLEEAAAEQARAEKLAKDELVKRTAALGREKLTAALDATGATYKAKDSCEELAKKLLRAQGQEVD